MSTVAKRYAAAFMDVARESGSLDPIGKDLHHLESLLADSAEFRDFVAHPLISPEAQSACIDQVFGNSAFPLTQNLFKLLISRERLSFLPEIVAMGLDLWRTEKGIQPVQMVSASKMSASQEKKLVDKLSTRSGKDIQLHTSVDDRLIGGFRLRIGDLVEDYSLASKLETFKRNVINA